MRSEESSSSKACVRLGISVVKGGSDWSSTSVRLKEEASSVNEGKVGGDSGLEKLVAEADGRWTLLVHARWGS